MEQDVTEIFRQYKDSVFRLALNYTRSVQDAEDICQTVFLKLLHQDSIKSGSEKAWLMKVTANESRNLLRSFWKRNIDPLEDVFPLRETKDGELLHRVMQLKTGYRVVIYLYYYEGYSAEEIAELLKISKTAVTTRLQRARQQLKKELEESGYEMANEGAF